MDEPKSDNENSIKKNESFSIEDKGSENCDVESLWRLEYWFWERIRILDLFKKRIYLSTRNIHSL